MYLTELEVVYDTFVFLIIYFAHGVAFVRVYKTNLYTGFIVWAIVCCRATSVKRTLNDSLLSIMLPKNRRYIPMYLSKCLK